MDQTPGPKLQSPPAEGDGDLQKGDIVAERYKVLQLIGRGAIGSVYLVEQIFLHRRYALKTLHPFQIPDVSLRRFQNEAQAASKLDHPNLVQAVDFGMIDDTRPFLVMDYIQGESLAQFFKRKGCMSTEEALELFIPLCFGMAYAHEQGIIHRDIKPANIMLVKDDKGKRIPKIVDFGIAKLQESEGQDLTKTGEIFGTPLYMSPEQCAGTKLDGRTDIYSLGCVFYEALTGAPPFRGNTALETMMKHTQEIALPLKEASLGQDFPPALEGVLEKMLAKNPAKRFQSFLEVDEALMLLKQGKKRTELKDSRSEKARRRNLFIFLPTTISIVLFIVVVVLTMQVANLKDLLKNAKFTHTEQAPIDTTAVTVISPVQTKIAYSVTEGLRKFDFGPQLLGNYWTAPDHNPFAIYQEADKTRKPAQSVQYVEKSGDVIGFEVNDETFRNGTSFLRFLPDAFVALRLEPSVAERWGDQDYLRQLDDDALYLLNNHKTLENVYICGPVSWKGLSNLADLPVLNAVNIERCVTQPPGTEKLSFISKLNLFKLAHWKNAGPGVLAAVRGSTKLAFLEVVDADVTDKDLTNLGSLTNLQSLGLDENPGVTDKSMKYIATLSKVNRLTLNATKVTSKSLPYLLSMPSLVTIVLPDEGWPKAVQKELKAKIKERIKRALSPEDFKKFWKKDTVEFWPAKAPENNSIDEG